jgi:nifR3 family TIM-barrel protein
MLAPMAGFTDAAFREVCTQWGADLTFTEMISCEGIIRKNKKTVDMLKPGQDETLLGVQLFTARPETAYRAVGILAELVDPVLLDLNCGCPVPKVVKTGAGVALMQEPSRLHDIIAALREAVQENNMHSSLSAKIRSGWNHSHSAYVEAADAALRGGASMITLHPRTRAQGYSGKANWSHIAELKKLFPRAIIIGSGDLFSPRDCSSMLTETGCDGIMIARGALGNPFIFSQTKELLIQGQVLHTISPARRMQTAWDHLQRTIFYKGEATAVREMKKHLCSYTKGMKGGASLRNRIVHCSTAEEYERIFRDYIEK